MPGSGACPPVGELSKPTVRRMSAIASEISLGNMDAPEFPVRGRDEIASLAESFTRMRRSLANAIKLLER